jgi:RNA polymerase sigma-70 factor (ECF subfamily)
MPEATDEFTGLMERVRAGDQAAAGQLFEHYGPHILRVVRRKLNTRLRSRFDSLDFVQDVWTSFFAGPPRQLHFDGPEDLIRLLANMAYNKVVDAFRREVQTQKKNAGIEHSFDSCTPAHGADLVARQPTPSQVAVAKEQWDRLLGTQPLLQQDMLLLLRQGDTHKEIADKLGVHVRTVRRLIHKLSTEPPA